MIRPGSILCLMAVASTGAAGSLRAQHVAASSSTIQSRIEGSGGGGSDQLIFVMNYSSQPIIVTGVRLMDCENVQGGCSLRKVGLLVAPGDRVMVQRVTPRVRREAIRFRYTYTWTLERADTSGTGGAEKDSADIAVDTVIVAPKLISLKVGETVDLSQTLSITALNVGRQLLPRVFFFTEVSVGQEFITVQGRTLTGKSAGTAALLIWASTVRGPGAPKRGASQVVVEVTP